MTTHQKRSRSEWKSVLVAFPLAEKRALVVEARRRGVTLNDLALTLLGAHYRIPVQLSNRRPRETNMTDSVRRILADALHLEIDLRESRRSSPFGGGWRRRRASDGRSR